MSDIRPLADAPSEILFVKPSWKENRYELADEGGACFGQLTRSGWTGKSTIEGAEGSWELSRPKGFLHFHIDVTGPDGSELGQYDLRQWKGGGTFELNGATYVIGHQGWSGTRFTVERDDTPLFEIKGKWGFGSEKAVAQLTDAGRRDPNGTLLLLLALEQMVAASHNAAAAGAAGAAAASS